MNRDSLADWLAWQDSLHWRKIDLGLARLFRVYERLAIPRFSCPVITVGGTNGKGSCVAMAAQILKAAGYRVGTFTSPHLVRYNERIQINGVEASDAELIAAFERIDAARRGETLTYFEFNTLAALLIFEAAKLDAVVLEVGMGGRLDTVNIVDADIALISSIGLDHCEYLGNDVEAIGREKAGIFRSGQTAIFGSRAMPQSIAQEARRLGTNLHRLGHEFEFVREGQRWSWRGMGQQLHSLPNPSLPGDVQFDNATAVIAALTALRSRLPVEKPAIDQGLTTVNLPGRYQKLRDSKGFTWILDVAHNPDAARSLAARLQTERIGGRTIAVCGIVADKDIDAVVTNVKDALDLWLVPQLESSRAVEVSALADRIRTQGAKVEGTFPSVAEACAAARTMADEADRVIVFGSFLTVGPALAWFNAQPHILAAWKDTSKND